MDYLIRILDTPEDMAKIEDLYPVVWGGNDLDVTPAHLTLAISHNGGVVLGAFDGERLIGFILGFLGTDHRSPDRPAMARLKHASHELAVDPEYRNQGVGYALKIAQRSIVEQQGVRLITWTYDPLLSLNAQLNIRRLGAVCDTYRENEYGEMRDQLNRGIVSDRFQVDWWITSNRVKQRLEGARQALDLAHFLSAGAVMLNQVRLGEDGLSRPDLAILEPESNLAIVEIPANYLDLRSKDHGLAVFWREHTRTIFQAAFNAGYLVTDFIYFREERFPRSYYILAHGEGKFG
ncbi:MAG: GNAT family N-acetyltransferase [Anaerolineales bacterium]|nr:GNAT family N-acetyltransferase [Anaerolineales bacterium]